MPKRSNSCCAGSSHLMFSTPIKSRLNGPDQLNSASVSMMTVMIGGPGSNSIIRHSPRSSIAALSVPVKKPAQSCLRPSRCRRSRNQIPQVRVDLIAFQNRGYEKDQTACRTASRVEAAAQPGVALPKNSPYLAIAEPGSLIGYVTFDH